MRSVAENASVMERINTLTSILAGVVAGLLNANLYSGILAYLGFHLIISLIIFGSLREIENYFLKKIEVFGGLASGVMVFLCGWIITFNLVYTL